MDMPPCGSSFTNTLAPLKDTWLARSEEWIICPPMPNWDKHLPHRGAEFQARLLHCFLKDSSPSKL